MTKFQCRDTRNCEVQQRLPSLRGECGVPEARWPERFDDTAGSTSLAARLPIAGPELFTQPVSITKSFFIQLAFCAKALEEEE
jgi:hypothetical protein